MATMVDYYNAMTRSQTNIAKQLGANPDMFPIEVKVLSATAIAMTSAILKTLTDAGVITDAALLANLNAVTSFDWSTVQL
jgi:hypothetical protein